MFDATSTTILFNAYANFSTIPWVGLPLAIFIWSFIKSSTYHQDNSSFHRGVRDLLDSQAFKKIIVPLFSFINEDLTQEVINDPALQAITNNGELLNAADVKKKEILKQRDFTCLESAIEFQDVIEKILKSKKNQITFKSYVLACRASVIGATIASGVTILVAIAWIYFQSVVVKDGFCQVFGVLWTIGFAVSLIFLGIYYYKTIIIDGLTNDKN